MSYTYRGIEVKCFGCFKEPMFISGIVTVDRGTYRQKTYCNDCFMKKFNIGDFSEKVCCRCGKEMGHPLDGILVARWDNTVFYCEPCYERISSQKIEDDMQKPIPNEFKVCEFEIRG